MDAVVNNDMRAQVAPANPAQVTGFDAVCQILAELQYEGGGFRDRDIEPIAQRIFAAIGAGGQAVADSLWVLAKPEHKKIGWTYDFDQTERLSRAAEKATGYEATMEVIEFVMAEADRRHKSALSQPHPADERVVEALRSLLTLTKFELADNVNRQPWARAIEKAEAALSATEDR